MYNRDMETVRGYPPNYEQIKNKFNLSGRNVVFTYGDKVYDPKGYGLSDHLEVHESTHIQQQAGVGPDAWWERYLQEPQFRLEQELEAYKNQYRYIEENYNRQMRRGLLKSICKDLASEIYGKIISKEEVENILLT